VKAALTAVVATAAATLALGASTTQPVAPTAQAKSATPLYGIAYSRAAAELSRFDPATLRPVGKRLRVTQDWPLWAFSPDRRQLALATERARLNLIDLRTMRVRSRFRGRRLVRGLAWPTPRRIVLAEHGETLVVDPAAGRIVRREVRAGKPLHTRRTRDELVLLGPLAEEIGRARLDVIGRDGRGRTVLLERILIGTDRGENDQAPWRSESPGLAVDVAGNRAFVVGGSGLVAEVDLATLAVSYRQPRVSRSLLSRLTGWLDPAAHAKIVDGPYRTAVWLDGVVAIAGYDAVTSGDTMTTHPYGLRLYDPRTNELRTIAPDATRLDASSGVLLAYGTRYDGRSSAVAGNGLSGYRADGTRRFHLFGTAPVETLFAAEGEAYVWSGGMLHAVDLAHGAVRTSRKPAGMVVFLTAGS
jgi:hypothetical protein